MEAPLHKLCGTRHWSKQPCPAMPETKNTPRPSGKARKAPGGPAPESRKADGIADLKQGAQPVAAPPRKGDRHRPGYFAEYQRNRRAKK